MSNMAHINELPRPRGRGGPSSPSANMAIREYFDNGTDHTYLAGWQTKPELPTVQEVMGTDQLGDDFTLTVNKTWGPWPSTDLYLETHYNLLREDAVAPLRDAIATVRQRPGMRDNNDLVIYERVRRTFTCESSMGWLAKYVLLGNRSSSHTSLWHTEAWPFEFASPPGVPGEESCGDTLLVFWPVKLLPCHPQTICS